MTRLQRRRRRDPGVQLIGQLSRRYDGHLRQGVLAGAQDGVQAPGEAGEGGGEVPPVPTTAVHRGGAQG